MKNVLGIEDADLSELIPKKERWEHVLLPDDKIAENGKIPAPPQIESSGAKITWKAHSEKDIIGYRVYRNGLKEKSIPAGQELSFTGSHGIYFVTAVDIAGNESPPSNMVMIGNAPVPGSPAFPLDTPVKGDIPDMISPGRTESRLKIVPAKTKRFKTANTEKIKDDCPAQSTHHRAVCLKRGMNSADGFFSLKNFTEIAFII